MFADSMSHEAVSQSGPELLSGPEMLSEDAYVPVNYLSPEVCALVAAAEASAARRALALGAADMQLDMNAQVSTLQNQSAPIGWYHPGISLSSMAPPKRFYRTFWRSISLRLLDQLSHCRQGHNFTRS
jgi:hypothetical protein